METLKEIDCTAKRLRQFSVAASTAPIAKVEVDYRVHHALVGFEGTSFVPALCEHAAYPSEKLGYRFGTFRG